MDTEPPFPIDNRNNILKFALELFSRRGYDAVGVQEIAIAAAVTKPTLYHYFESKAGLLNAIIDEGGRNVLGPYRVAAHFQGDVPLTLERIAFALVGSARSEPVFYRFLLSLHFAPSESEASGAARELLAEFHMIMKETFDSAARQLGNMNGRESLFAASFLGLLNTWIGLELNGQIVLNDATIRSVVRQFMYGIHS